MQASELRARARLDLAGNWGLAVGTALLAGLLGGSISSGGSFSININLGEASVQELPPFVLILIIAVAAIGGILGTAAFIIGGTVQLGYCSFLLKQHDSKNPEIRDLFSKFDQFGNGFAQAFLRGLYTMLWSLLFVIPGIIKGYAYAMTPFIMADHPEMTASQAITASQEMMHGHKLELFLLELSFFGWSLLSLLTLGIGNLFLIPYMDASRAAFYRSLEHPYLWHKENETCHSV